jgi:hypothetical protein
MCIAGASEETSGRVTRHLQFRGVPYGFEANTIVVELRAPRLTSRHD